MYDTVALSIDNIYLSNLALLYIVVLLLLLVLILLIGIPKAIKSVRR